MPEFNYKAKDRNGIAHAGAIAAPSRTHAATLLRERGWVVLRLDALAERLPRTGFDFRPADWLPPRSVHVEVSIQQLSLMLRSGMPLLAALSSVAEQSPNRALGNAWNAVNQQIQSGRSLSQALTQHRCFPEYVSRLVAVGEQTGNLEVVLRRAATAMKNRRGAREAFASATIYPLLILVLSIAVTIYMVAFLIPRLDAYLQSLGKEMPAMTQTLIDASVWLRGNYMTLIVLALAGIGAGVFAYLSKEGRLWIDQHVLRMPVVGQLLRIRETASFARSLSLMLKSGITLTEGLAAVQNILSNRFLQLRVGEARQKIIRGSSLVEALQYQAAFGPLLTRMAAVGQQTGELHVVLHEVAELYDAQFDSRVKRLNAILTPAMTIGIGGIVGYVYIAFFMALVAAGT